MEVAVNNRATPPSSNTPFAIDCPLSYLQVSVPAQEKGSGAQETGTKLRPIADLDELSQLAFKGSREEVELFFATNALTFVVGWSWVILARDLSTLTSTALSEELEITSLPTRLLLSALTAFVYGPLVGIIVTGCL